MSDKDAVSRLAEAKRLVTQELHKQGTPDYDPRSHQRAIEAERKAQDAVDAERRAQYREAPRTYEGSATRRRHRTGRVAHGRRRR